MNGLNAQFPFESFDGPVDDHQKRNKQHVQYLVRSEVHLYGMPGILEIWLKHDLPVKRIRKPDEDQRAEKKVEEDFDIFA